MGCLVQILTKTRQRCSQRGFTLVETMIALGVASISILGAYGLTLAIERHYRGSAAAAELYGQSRIVLERLSREISETSNKTITIRNNAISFASARDENGDFQLEIYNDTLNFARPAWQKAIIYYVFDNPRDGDGPKLYRKEIAKADWSTNYDPVQEIGGSGEAVAYNVTAISFSYSPAESLAQAHTLNVSLELTAPQKAGGANQSKKITSSIRVTLMTKEK